MGQRTTQKLVAAILMNATQTNYDGSTDLTQFIRIAHNTVDRVQVCAAAKGKKLTDDGEDSEAEQLERLIAAHWYCVNDPLYSGRSTAGASGQFQRGTPGRGYDSTHFGQMALDFDPSGCLMNINKRQTASVAWGGKPACAQLTYEERN